MTLPNGFSPIADKADNLSAEPNRKAQQILDGARSAFIELGFDGASMDEIARRAGVSKPTLYHHFQDKRAVFTAFVRRDCAEQGAQIFNVDLSAPGIESALQTIGRRYLDLVLSPLAEGAFRIVVAEATRFPDLGRVAHASGMDLGARRLAVLLAAAIGRGELKIDDVELAALQFLELCKVDVHYRLLFRVSNEIPDDDRSRVVNSAVAMFMRAYGS